MFDYKNYFYFALISPREGRWSFSSYEKEGKTFRAIDGYKTDGSFRNFDFYFGERERTYMVPKKKTINVIVNEDYRNPVQMTVGEYLKRAPYYGVMYRLLDEIADAKDVVDIKRHRINAENRALALEGDSLKDVCVLLGEFSDNPDVQQRTVLEFAGRLPDKFLELVDSAERPIKATLLKAVKAGIMRRNGHVLSWEKDINSEDQWIEILAKDKDKLKILQTAIKKLK